MKKIFLIIGILSILSASSHAAGWTLTDVSFFLQFLRRQSIFG